MRLCEDGTATKCGELPPPYLVTLITLHASRTAGIPLNRAAPVVDPCPNRTPGLLPLPLLRSCRVPLLCCLHKLAALYVLCIATASGTSDNVCLHFPAKRLGFCAR